MTALTDYLDDKLGRGTSSGAEREYPCFKCIDRIGSESGKRKLRINFVKGVAYCHRCGYGVGSIERLLKDMNGGRLTLEELSLIRKESRPPVEGLGVAVRSILTPKPPPGAEHLSPVPLPDWCSSVTARLTGCQSPTWSTDQKVQRGIGYLIKRKVSVETAASFDVRYCHAGKYAGYLVFPVRMFGLPVYWTTRYAGECPSYIPKDSFKKTWNIPHEEGDYGKSDVILNYDGVVGQPVVSVVEGPFDCMAMPAAISLLGKLPSERQIDLLMQLVQAGTEEFVLALDPDATRESEILMSTLRGLVPRVSLLPLDHGDPSSRSDEVPELLASRVAERPLSTRVRLRFQRSK